uniref:Uncharacterized protein n=1 Tax=Anopheles minimus TaxID=112268 RepID=A0A182WCX8_9DIPT
MWVHFHGKEKEPIDPLNSPNSRTKNASAIVANTTNMFLKQLVGLLKPSTLTSLLEPLQTSPVTAQWKNTAAFGNLRLNSTNAAPAILDKSTIETVNKQVEAGLEGRLFAVVQLCGKQFKITSGDIIVVEGYWPPENGDRLRLDKVLLAGSKDFSLIGRPLLTPGLVDVQATIVEKTLSHTRTHFRKKRRKQYIRINFYRAQQTMIRINSIDITRKLANSANVNSLKMLDPVLQRHLKGHRGKLTGLSFNPEGTRFVTSSVDHSAIVWTNNEQVRCMRFEAHEEAVNDVCWSPDGRIIATVSKDRSVKIWVPSMLGNCDEFRGHTSNVRSVDFDPTGRKLLTASDDKTVKLWKVSRKQFLSSFTGHTNWVRCARFSPNGKMIASCGDDRSLKLFDPATGQCIHTFHDQKGGGCKVAWHPDSTLVAIALDNCRVKIFDVNIRKLIQYYRIYDGSVNSLDFHPSGNYLITGSDDGVTKIIDLLEGRQIFTLTGHRGPVTAVKFSKDGELFATGSEDCHVMLWKANLDPDSAQHLVYSPDSTGELTNPTGGDRKFSFNRDVTEAHADDDDSAYSCNKENLPDTSIFVDATKTENFKISDAVEVSE